MKPRWLRRVLCPFARFFHNPHHLAAVVFAMLMTNAATMLWALIIIAGDDALVRSGSSLAGALEGINEDLLAAVLGSIALAQTVCLWTHWEPTRFRNIGYGLLSICWSFAFFRNVTHDGPLYPLATSLTAVMAFSAFYAWLDGHEE